MTDGRDDEGGQDAGMEKHSERCAHAQGNAIVLFLGEDQPDGVHYFFGLTGVSVALPKTATTNLPSGIEDPIILSITRDGRYYINETAVARGLLRDRLNAFLRSRKDRTVFLKADRALSYGTVVETLDILNRMGIESLGMITETPVSPKK